jgi:hypothetical protein
MPIRSEDDFGAFDGNEHMMFGLDDSFDFIRDETESGLRRQVPDAVLERIVTYGEPKFLTLGRKTDDGSRMVVSYHAFCVRAQLTVSRAGGAGHELIEALLTFLFGDVDRPGSERCQTYFDVHRDAKTKFTDEVFESRFRLFRHNGPH